jgi:hypothetical protein
MPVARRLIAQAQDDSQILKLGSTNRFVLNIAPDWQMLFGRDGAISESTKVLKIAAQFDTTDFDKIRIVAYIYDPDHEVALAAASASFKIYLVSEPNWQETLLTTVNGALIGSNYFFSEITLLTLTGANLDGDSTLMIEATVVRGTRTFTDRIYVNHLGSYDSIVRLRGDVEFLDLTKLDE